MKNIVSLVFLTIVLVFSCKTSKTPISPPSTKPLTFTSRAAPEWTALFDRTSGWFGADGIFSIPLDGKESQQVEDKRTLFIFSDTYIGEVENNVPKPGNVMVNNSLAWLLGNEPQESQIAFKYHKENNQPKAYFIPHNSQSKEGEYFWLGDGFVNQEKENALYIFGYHVHKTGPNVFDFEQTNITLLKVKNPLGEELFNYEQIPTPLGFIHPKYGRVYFGSGLLVNTKKAMAPNPDGYVYIYGIMGANKSLIAARTRPVDIENFQKWTFWNGEKWVRNKEAVAPITDGISNELSVTPTEDGRYLLTFQILGISDKVGIQVGKSPIGPFGKINEVYTCPEYQAGLLPYNAKAHYHLSKPGELLISYNTITFNFWEDIQKDASIYHPRFIWVRYE